MVNINDLYDSCGWRSQSIFMGRFPGRKILYFERYCTFAGRCRLPGAGKNFRNAEEPDR
jgi:hypothetical protein